MNTRTRCAGFFVVCHLLFATSASLAKSPPAVPHDGVEIQSILTEVQRALETSSKEVKDLGMPPLESVTLTLQATATSETGGKIKLWILSFGHSVKHETVQELTLILAPPDPNKPKNVATPPSLAAQLVDAIIGAARGVQNARRGDPPLELRAFEVTLSFLVARDTSGGADFTIQPVTAGLTGDLKNSALHKLKLVFKAPAGPGGNTP